MMPRLPLCMNRRGQLHAQMRDVPTERKVEAWIEFDNDSTIKNVLLGDSMKDIMLPVAVKSEGADKSEDELHELQKVVSLPL